MANIDYYSVFDFLQEAIRRIDDGAPTPFAPETGKQVINWLRNKAVLDQRASVRKFADNV